MLQSVYENGPETITLFLHGLNSNAGTWDILNFDEYYDNCLKVTATDVGSASSKPAASCYLYTFMDRDANGSSWPAGDGSTFGQLGEETGKVVDWIRSRHNLRVLIVVGHSRGGLAARAYLQALGSRLPFRVGLVTVGTPHLGSPFGRLQWWLSKNNKQLTVENCWWAAEAKLQFAFSPSTGFLATAHDSNGRSIRNTVSDAIWALNGSASGLKVDLLGEVRSKLMLFGENVNVQPVYVDAETLIACLTESDSETRSALNYSRENLPQRWLTEGDGIVPFESQQILKVPGLPQGLTVWYIDLASKTSHVSEPMRTGQIKAVVDKVSEELTKMPLVVPASEATAEVSAAIMSHVPEQKRESNKNPVSARLTVLARKANISDLLLNGGAENLYELGNGHLSRSTLASDFDGRLGVELLLRVGTEKAVNAILRKLNNGQKWNQDSESAHWAKASEGSRLKSLKKQ